MNTQLTFLGVNNPTSTDKKLLTQAFDNVVNCKYQAICQDNVIIAGMIDGDVCRCDHREFIEIRVSRDGNYFGAVQLHGWEKRA